MQRYGTRYGKRASTQLYSGPFKLVKWRSNCKTRVLAPNPYYWDKRHVYLHRLTITTATSLKTDLKNYRAGKLDEVQLFDNQITENKNQPDYLVRPFSSMRFISYNFKTTNKTADQLINNQDARLAISHAINRKTLINNALKNASLAPKGLVTAGLSKNVKTKADFADQQAAQSTVKGNTALAKKEWQQAQQTLHLSHYSLTLTVANDWASKRVATNIKHQLETKLNHFDVKIRTVRTSTANRLALNGQYQLLLSSWGADYPDPLSFLQIMTANSRFNYGSWQNKAYNNLIIKISNNPTGNQLNRWQEMLDAEKLLMTNQAVTPLYQQADSYLSNPKLNGVVYNISGVVADYKSAYLVK
ncbi:peptide ABC transporter substrate-binding protein [Secundilactobacillus paracollinoides]|uniref:peptide ABC transporter substrate-binding protein n=1 Tax=Secundilactobacillus paracollinoides TaxID=240427 RepID=UPI0009F386B9|nr:peptide ABC transporter substrate-binding protein [Secundilactobacillus paracollinoides]